MSLPKVKVNMGKFSIGRMLRGIGRRSDAVFASLEPEPGRQKEKTKRTLCKMKVTVKGIQINAWTREEGRRL
ncbi:hypothetical protein GF415_00380 [Candidatus Micrarchaeota archaeon]|nr:hypothetical protein [Candidatus Micrarchaeota archaeon]